MKNPANPLILIIVVLTIISCHNLESCDNLPLPGQGTEISSSSGSLSSSSSEEVLYNFCVYHEIQECFDGPYAFCPADGELANNCIYRSEDI